MPIVSRGERLIARAANNIWFIFIPLVAGAAIVGSVWAVGNNSASKADIKTFAIHQAQIVNAQSRQRSIDNCNRSNPGRAYLLLRAQEVASSTARTARYVFEILSCERVIDSHGQPIPVSIAVENEYLKMFSKCRIPTLLNGRITGSQDFATYFHHAGHCK